MIFRASFFLNPFNWVRINLCGMRGGLGHPLPPWGPEVQSGAWASAAGPGLPAWPRTGPGRGGAPLGPLGGRAAFSACLMVSLHNLGSSTPSKLLLRTVSESDPAVQASCLTRCSQAVTSPGPSGDSVPLLCPSTPPTCTQIISDLTCDLWPREEVAAMVPGSPGLAPQVQVDTFRGPGCPQPSAPLRMGRTAQLG